MPKESRHETAVRHLQNIGALLTDDHFVLTSGRHSSAYLNPDIIYQNPKALTFFAGEIARSFGRHGCPFDAVAGPANGGNYLALAVGTWYEQNRNHRHDSVRIAYTKKLPDKRFAFEYPGLLAGNRLLVVEDVTTTADSVIATIQEAKRHGAIVRGIAVLWNRAHDARVRLAELACIEQAPISIVIDEPLGSYEPDCCPLCEVERPINETVGHGKEFVEKMRRLESGQPRQSRYANV